MGRGCKPGNYIKRGKEERESVERESRGMWGCGGKGQTKVV